jgi:hypothetical protein
MRFVEYLKLFFTNKQICCKECLVEIGVITKNFVYAETRNKKLITDIAKLKEKLEDEKINREHWYNQSESYKRKLKENGLFGKD